MRVFLVLKKHILCIPQFSKLSAGAAEEMETPECTSKKFTNRTDELAFTERPYKFHSTEVYLLRPPKSLSSTDRPWITARETTADYTYVFRHPLTSKPHSFKLPPYFYISKLNPLTLTVYYAFQKPPYSVDKLLLLQSSQYSYLSANRGTLFALYGGGLLQGCPRVKRRRWRSTPSNSHPVSPWVKLTKRYRGDVKFDDIIDFQDKVYAIDRQGITNLVNYYKTVAKISMGKTLIFEQLTPGSGQFGWRKRFAVDEGVLYVVVRTEEKLFQVFRLKSWVNGRGKTCYYWDRVKRFKGNKVLFMGRDHYFFLKASRKFPGREHRNCIVFSEAAFPQYGNDGWEFTESDNVRRCEDDIAVFRLGDERFAREEEWENSGFPKIDWSPPDWISNVSSFPADEFNKYPESEFSSQSVRERDDDEGLDFVGGGKNDGEVQSNLKNSKSKNEEEQEEMESDFCSQDQDQVLVESDSESKDQEDQNMQCDLKRQEKEDEEMHSEEADIESDAPLQKDPVTPSRSVVEEEVTRTLLRMNSGNDAVEEETSGKDITQAMPKASTSSRTESPKSYTATTKFEGLDIRSDLVPILQKIWHNHGNIVKDSIVRSGDIVARALESMAAMVQILEDNPIQFLSDSQADYLNSTLSDLRNICFKVHWLVSYVEKALKVHKSKPLVESLNNLSQLSSKVKERRAILLGELANLDEEENKLKEEMMKVSKMIPFSGQVKLDEPIGAGLT
ncbi:uncharacterized protein LOC141610876 [Silene latifolia]|uniref:uncharacterized protein LOC141610876 n=1 Tax=Silene latifolia TaxID=37657 RepID=UPI003D7803C9